ncbi:glycosyltransferase family protein [Limobrevibacterium gyesilva]|uniref:Glycosyltransferase n=1 Tax=Limobrevibacterium gyesilva TaxID=2991712 RepID=A0AA41YIS4_9PROT|nr:hypothetical protein [Limobrevibacterium gyesilva]MCW3473874.1 hypothetical protein [Limobrevibacterium gyesilva]
MDAISRSKPAGSSTGLASDITARSDPAIIHSRFTLAPVAATTPGDTAPPEQDAARARSEHYADPGAATIAPHVDVAYYRAIYPDIGRLALDPVTHFHAHGWREGRNPNSWFDTRYYLAANPDIAAAGIDPLQHYVTHGRAEGRQPRRSGGALRAVVEAATPPSARPLGYDAPADADRLEAPDLHAAIAARCVGANGLVVSASHDRYIDVTGGVQILIADEQALFNGDRFAYLHLSPAIARLTLDPGGDEPALLQVVLDGRFLGLATGEAVAAALALLPDTAAPARIFTVHSVFGHRWRVLAAVAAALQARHSFFWLHDYASLCEGYNLLRDDALFCGAPPEDSMACRICVYGGERAGYRAELRALFDAVPFHVLAPSPAALQLWLRSAGLPHLSARVHANLVLQEGDAEAPASGQHLPVRVAFVGFPMAHKGWPLFRTLVEQARTLDAYRFYHLSIAETLQPMDGLIGVPAQVDRDDRFAMVAALAALQIDLVLVLSPWPETFSYVTHEAFAAGADVVALACAGNVADAVRRHDRGVVLRDDAALLRFFLDLHAVRYAEQRAAAALRPARLLACGTTATVALDAPDGPDPDRLATPDPALRVIAGDAVILPARDGDGWRFALPAQAGIIRLVSRSVVPAQLSSAARDQRRLGVAVGRLMLDGAIVPPGDARRLSGWHGAEDAWEWTSGDATLDAGEARMLEVTLARLATYFRSPLAGSG